MVALSAGYIIIIHILKNDFLLAKKTNDHARVKIVFIKKGYRYYWSKDEKKGGRRV